MAHYHLHTKIMGRSPKAGCRAAVACAAYRAGEELRDERYGVTHDYSRKRGVLHSEILTPENTPEWMQDRERLWNAVEAAAKRKDAQLAKEYELALPRELSHEQHVDLVRRYVRERFVSKGMIADIAIHAPHAEIPNDNHHAHVMLTMREITADGFGQAFNTRDKAKWGERVQTLTDERKDWAAFQNREFERLGLDVRVDHRSNEERGIDREPEAHLGPAASAIKRRGGDSRIANDNESREDRNRQRMKLHLSALHELARIEEERSRFLGWTARKQDELAARQQQTREELRDRQADEVRANEVRLRDFYEPHLVPLRHEAARLEKLATDTGMIARARRLFRGREDARQLAAVQASIADAETRMAEARGALRRKHEADLERLRALQAERQREQREGIARKAREKEAVLKAWHERARDRAARTADAVANDNPPTLDRIKREREKWRQARSGADREERPGDGRAAQPTRAAQRRGKLERDEARLLRTREVKAIRRRSLEEANAERERQRQQRQYDIRQQEKAQAAEAARAAEMERRRPAFEKRKEEIRAQQPDQAPRRSFLDRLTGKAEPKPQTTERQTFAERLQQAPPANQPPAQGRTFADRLASRPEPQQQSPARSAFADRLQQPKAPPERQRTPELPKDEPAQTRKAEPPKTNIEVQKPPQQPAPSLKR